MSETIVRAVSLPLYPPDGMEWGAFWEKIRASWDMSTDLANWCVRQLEKHDTYLDNPEEKLGVFKKSFSSELYRLWNRSYSRHAEWNGLAASANCILRKVSQKYFGVSMVGKGKKFLPHRVAYQKGLVRSLHFRYPFPFLVHNQSWSMEWKPTREEEKRLGPMLKAEKEKLCIGRPVLIFNLLGERVVCNLRNGPEFGRQLSSLKQICRGEAKKGELMICENGSHIMAKIIGTFPKTQHKEAEETLIVRTDPKAFLVAQISGQTHAWILNADQARRWQASHRVFLQRTSEDLKYEKRWPKKTRERMVQARQKREEKYDNRMDTFLNTVTKMVVQYAIRRNVAHVCYDDDEKLFLGDGFRYHDLKTLLRQKCEAQSITFKSGE